MPNQTKQESVTECQQFIAGIQKHTSQFNITIASQPCTAKQLVTSLQALVTSGTSVLETKTAWHDAVQGDNQVVAQYGSLVGEIRQAVAMMFSKTPSALADFGMTPRKAAKPLSSEALAAKAAKARATRLARGTTSKKQKSTVSGNVTGVTITPNVLPTASTPAASIAPAPTAPVASAVTAAVTPSAPVAAGAGILAANVAHS
jgi:hypothetical protein